MVLQSMSDGFSSIEEIFNREPAFDGLRKRMKEAAIIDKFNTIFPDLAKIVVPVKVERSTLFIKVENPAWRSELKFNEQVIIKKINVFFGEERIKYLKFSSK